jgi:hypothetical protein
VEQKLLQCTKTRLVKEKLTGIIESTCPGAPLLFNFNFAAPTNQAVIEVTLMHHHSNCPSERISTGIGCPGVMTIMHWLCEQTTKTGGVLLIIGWFCGKEILQYFSLAYCMLLLLRICSRKFLGKIEIITIKGTT